jgi:UDP-N-acetylglucosamine acyltransferase
MIHPSAEIHSTAIVEEGARIAAGCRIGPYCVVGADVAIGAGTILHPHVVVAGWTEIGPDCVLHPFASLGQPPQDLRYRGERVELVVGARTTIREYASLSPGTPHGGGITRVGDECYFMINSHVAHDCKIGDRVIMANCVSLAGHVEIGDGANIGGLVGVHQRVRIGEGAMIGGLSAVAADVIPYGMVAGERCRLIGLNLIGLKRRQVPRAAIHELRAAFGEMFEGEGTLAERVEAASARHADNELVALIAEFVLGGSNRSFTLPPPVRGDG